MKILNQSQLEKIINEESRPHVFLKESFQIRASECDQNDIVHTDVISSILQEVAHFHSYQSDIKTDELYQDGYYWILNRMSLRFVKHPVWLDKVNAYTWQSGIDRLGFMRDYYLFDEQGNAYGCGRSYWTLVSAKDHKLLNPLIIYPELQDSMVSNFTAFDEAPIRLRRNFADFNQAVSFEKYVGFSDIDKNRHMNNTRYIALCVDAANKLEIQGTLKSLDINYLAESLLGESLTTEANRIMHADAADANEAKAKGDHLLDTKTIAVRAIGSDETERFRACLIYTA